MLVSLHTLDCLHLACKFDGNGPNSTPSKIVKLGKTLSAKSDYFFYFCQTVQLINIYGEAPSRNKYRPLQGHGH